MIALSNTHFQKSHSLYSESLELQRETIYHWSRAWNYIIPRDYIFPRQGPAPTAPIPVQEALIANQSHQTVSIEFAGWRSRAMRCHTDSGSGFQPNVSVSCQIQLKMGHAVKTLAASSIMLLKSIKSWGIVSVAVWRWFNAELALLTMLKQYCSIPALAVRC